MCHIRFYISVYRTNVRYRQDLITVYWMDVSAQTEKNILFLWILLKGAEVFIESYGLHSCREGQGK